MFLALRTSCLAIGAGLVIASVPASAQVRDDIVLNILRECAKISDPTSRLACYDNNIRAAGAAPSSVPGQMPAPAGGGAVQQPDAPGGFGAEDLRSRDRFDPERNGPSEIAAQVVEVTERQPGVYLITLGNGAQWLFTESAGREYRPPRRGERVEIRRAALGSYLLVAGKQQGIRVTRVK